MGKFFKITIVCKMLLALGLAEAQASGYQLNLFGQRQIGMGHTGVGMPVDLATISMNPAGLAVVDRNGFLIGGNATFLTSSFRTSPEFMPGLEGSYRENTNSPVRIPFSFYAGTDLPVDNLRVGIGVYTPYGNSIRWADDWLYSPLLTEISLQAVFIQPTLSYELTEGFSIGAGLIYAIGSVNLQREERADFSPVGLGDDVPVGIELDGSTTGFGYNAGLYYDYNGIFSAGVSYRSEISMNLEDGDATFTLPPEIPEAFVESQFPPGTTFNSSLPLPAVLSFGLGYQASSDLRFAFDANLTFWSTYESLSFELSENTLAISDTEEPRNFNDSWTFRAGGEWDATERLQLRLGTYADFTPVEEGFITPETPDTDRYGFTAGAGYMITDALGVDASLIVVTSSWREQGSEDAAASGTPEAVPVGEFRNTAIIPGLAVHYSF
ncbi:MAG: outer membrane protein transport protein [Balneolia bacterium]|nr:outer membrane protein transport protein [Balneolia bacterium]